MSVYFGPERPLGECLNCKANGKPKVEVKESRIAAPTEDAPNAKKSVFTCPNCGQIPRDKVNFYLYPQ